MNLCLFLLQVQFIFTLGFLKSQPHSFIEQFLANIYLFKVNNRNTRKRSGNIFRVNNKNSRTMSLTSVVLVFLFNFGHTLHLFLLFLMLTLTKQMLEGCFIISVECPRQIFQFVHTFEWYLCQRDCASRFQQHVCDTSF